MSAQNIEIHPSAQENYNQKVSSLVGSIVKAPREDKECDGFNSDIHVAVSIGDGDIIGEIQEELVDCKGVTVGRFFMCNGDRYGIIEEAYARLSKVAESIQGANAFGEKVSRKYVEDKIFIWLKNRFLGQNEVVEFVTYFLKEVVQAVEKITILVPIANVLVETPFEFCGSTIRSLSKDMVDEMAAISNTITDEASHPNAKRFIEEFRGKYQGYAVAEINLVCESEFASDLAIRIATRTTDLMGIYSGAVLSPEVKCTSRIKGCENIFTYTTINKKTGGGFIVKNGILDSASSHPWHISKSDLVEMRECGFDIISLLAVKKKPTEFELVVLNMASLYSKAAFTSDPMEKLVHVLSSLESTLLRNENEPIQQNLAERVAFFIAKELVERKEIIKNIKHVYGLRSRYLHHGHTSGDLAEMSKFFFHVWVFYVNLVLNSSRFSSKTAFLNAIDDRKLS